jgi:hypothetical protein
MERKTFYAVAGSADFKAGALAGACSSAANN